MPAYHWTPELQRQFIECLAETGSVTEAAHEVSMSRRAAYNLRNRREGLAFRIGWDAAALLARDVVEGELTDRALAGSWTETIKDPDTGRTRRLSHDRGLSLALLTRLDKKCQFLEGPNSFGMAAQIASTDFEAFLDLVEAGGDLAALQDFIEDRRMPWQTGDELRLDARIERKAEPANDCELAENSAVSDTSPVFHGLPTKTPKPGTAAYHNWIKNQPWARMG